MKNYASQKEELGRKKEEGKRIAECPARSSFAQRCGRGGFRIPECGRGNLNANVEHPTSNLRISDAERVPEGESLRDDAVCANGKRNDDVTVNDEENTIFFGDIKVENLVAMPEHVREFMTAQRRMSPVR